MKLLFQKHPILLTSIFIIAAILICTSCKMAKDIASFYHTKIYYSALLKKIAQERSSSNSDQKIEMALQEHIFSFHSLLQQLQKYHHPLPSEQTSMTPLAVQDSLQRLFSQLKQTAQTRKIILPKKFFLCLEQYENVPPSPQKAPLILEQKTFLEELFVNLFRYSNLELHEAQLEQPSEEKKLAAQLSPPLFSCIGTVVLRFTTKEKFFRSFLNQLTKSSYFFLTESLHIENNHQIPPVHQPYTPLKQDNKTTPFFGQESITITMRIKLMNLLLSEQEKINLQSPVLTASKKSNLFEKASQLLQRSTIWKTSNTPLFTSRYYLIENDKLIDLEETTIPLHPPIPNRWFLEHDLDITDSNILNKDSDHDGFTNLEEWLGNEPYSKPGTYSTDPNNPQSHPPLWTKLKYAATDLHLNKYSLDFINYEKEKTNPLFDLQPKTALPHLTQQGKTVWDTKIQSVHLGETLSGLPLQLLTFEKKENIHHQIFYDTSTITLLDPQTKRTWTLTKKSTLHPESTEISLINKVTLHYLLPSPPQEFSVQQGDLLSLKSLPYLNPDTQLEEQDTETYKVLDITSEKVVLEKDGEYLSLHIN